MRAVLEDRLTMPIEMGWNSDLSRVGFGLCPLVRADAKGIANHRVIAGVRADVGELGSEVAFRLHAIIESDKPVTVLAKVHFLSRHKQFHQIVIVDPAITVRWHRLTPVDHGARIITGPAAHQLLLQLLRETSRRHLRTANPFIHSMR